MATDLKNKADKFSKLDMTLLIGEPLTAASEMQMKLAKSTADFIESLASEPSYELEANSSEALKDRQN